MLSSIKQFIKRNDTLRLLARLLIRSGESSPLVYHCRDYTSSDFVRTLLKVLVTPYCMLKYFVVREYPGREGLAFVLIAKNEASYIKEWLDFHIKQGVTNFIIYDNESTDNFREVLQPYIEAGIVIYELLRGRRRQLDAYNIALNKYRHRFKYMGFIDADEFVFVRNNPYRGGGYNLYEFVDGFMKAYPHAGCLRINWLIFGSNHREKRPEGGVLENYTMCAEKDFPPNHFTKLIGDPAKLVMTHVHAALCRKNYYELDENGEITRGQPKEVHFDKIRINHYFCKSKEEYITIKTQRGDGFFGQQIKDMNSFNYHDQNIYTNTEILSRR